MAAVATRYLVSYGVFVLVTVYLTLGKWLAESVLGTRWEEYAPSIRYVVVLWGPDVVVATLVCGLLGWRWPRHWLACAAVFAGAFLLISHSLRLSPLSVTAIKLLAGDSNLLGQNLVSATLIYGGVFIGAAVGARRGRKRLPQPGHCTRCRYDLRGLPENRCPECGTEFDPATTGRAIEPGSTEPPSRIT